MREKLLIYAPSVLAGTIIASPLISTIRWGVASNAALLNCTLAFAAIAAIGWYLEEYGIRAKSDTCFNLGSAGLAVGCTAIGCCLISGAIIGWTTPAILPHTLSGNLLLYAGAAEAPLTMWPVVGIDIVSGVIGVIAASIMVGIMHSTVKP